MPPIRNRTQKRYRTYKPYPTQGPYRVYRSLRPVVMQPAGVLGPRASAIKRSLLAATETQVYQTSYAYNTTVDRTNQIGCISGWPVDSIPSGSGLNLRDKGLTYPVSTSFSFPCHNGTQYHVHSRVILLKVPEGYLSTSYTADSLFPTLFIDLNGNAGPHANDPLAPSNFNLLKPINQKHHTVLFDRIYYHPPGNGTPPNPNSGSIFRTPDIPLSGVIRYEADGAPTNYTHPAYIWLRMFENVQNIPTSVGSGALTQFKYKEI